MFGQDEDNKTADASQPISTQPVNNGLLGISDDDDTSEQVTVNNGSSSSQPSEDQTSTDNDTSSEPVTEASPSQDAPSEASSTDDSSSNVTTPDVPAETGNNELLDIKRQALQELSPLVDQLDQTPDEKFKTTMMMIQASDSQALIPAAYQAAKEISDEKVRAQALLDIVNEINYFTQKDES